MKQLLKIILFTALIFSLHACAEPEEQVFTKDGMLGRWNISGRSFALTQDCEKNEYIIFNADSTVFRQQCGQITGTWYVENEKLLLNLALDTMIANATYTCEFIAENEIKVKLDQNAFLWASYKKAE